MILGIILVIFGILMAFVLGLIWDRMTKEGSKVLEKAFSEIVVAMAFLMSIAMLAFCCFAIWILIDETSAVTFIFQGAVREPIFVGEYAFLKWIIFLPLPFAIPWIISRMIYVLNHKEKTDELA